MKWRWKRCPFPTLGLVFIGIIGVSVVLTSELPALQGRRLPFLGTVLATLVVAMVVEMRRRRLNSCPWLDFGGAARLALYLALFVVGVVVVLPGIWPTRDVEWTFRIAAVLLAIAFPALLAIHLKVDHGELEEAGVRRSLVFASRLPLYLIRTVIVVILLGSFLTLLGVLR
jgi:hypothetical protein